MVVLVGRGGGRDRRPRRRGIGASVYIYNYKGYFCLAMCPKGFVFRLYKEGIK